MMPIIKSSQIVGQARPLRALGIVRQKPGLKGEAAMAVPQQLKAKGLAGEDQRENEVLSVNGEPGKRVAPGSSELCKEGLSLPASTNVTLAHDASIDVEDADSRAACDSTALNLEDPPTLDVDAVLADGRQQGWNAGYEHGMQEGLRLGQEEVLALQSCNQRLAAVTEAISVVSQGWQAELEGAAIEIGYAALLRIVGQGIGDRAMVEGMVRTVLEQLPERRLLNIHLAPADHALFQHDEGASLSPGAVLLADERVSMGGCIVDTGAGSLDGRLETRLAELKAVLVDMHHAREIPQ